MKAALDFAIFYVGWFACVGGAARGWLAVGPLATAAIVALHLWRVPDPPRQLRFLAAAALIGFLADTTLACAGLFAFTHTSAQPWLSPPWMVSLWVLFATTFESSLAWLRRRYAVGALFGGIGGPMSYVVGARLGAITLSPDREVALAGIAIAWAAFVPALLWLRELVTDTTDSTSLAPPR